MSKINELFKKELQVVNFGVEAFYTDLKDRQVKAVQMDWRPPAGGNRELAAMLELLK